MIATAQRLIWQVHSATEVTTDEGRTRSFALDSPKVVKKECQLAVHRWRDKKIFANYPELEQFHESHGACVSPVRRVLDPKSAAPSGWNAALRVAWQRQLRTDNGARIVGGRLDGPRTTDAACVSTAT